MVWTEGDAPAGLPGRFVAGSTGAIVTPVVAGVEPVLVEPGQTYLVEAWVHGSGAPGAYPTTLALVTVSGSTLDLIPDSTVEVDGLLRPITGTPPSSDAFLAYNWTAPAEWTRIGAHFTAPAGVSEVYVYGTLPAGGAIAGVSVRRALVGEDIVAEEVAAAVGVFIDAMMENLTVTGAANISEAAIGELTARVATILTLNAEQVIVGRDARFWDGGLEFYAPPAEGQDPTDWANRIPIISLMPSGDVAISVAQDGETTAGLAEDGTVWGRRGTFDTLEVAGQDVPSLVEARAGGIVGAAQLDGNLSVFTTRRAVLGLRVRMEAGRMYRVDWHAGITLGTGTMRMELEFTDPNVVYYRTQPTVQSTGSVTGAFLVVPTWASGGRDVTVTMVGAVDSGETIFRTGSWITLEDKGPAVPIETATSANPVAGTQLHTRRITSEVGRSYTADGSAYWANSQYMGFTEYKGLDGAWQEHVRYAIALPDLTGATIVSAQLAYTVRTVKSSGVVAFTMYAGGAGMTNQQLIASQVKGRGGHTYDILPERLDRLVGKTGIVFSPTYPNNASNRFARLGETVTLTLKYRK